jgi:hypothetical protein
MADPKDDAKMDAAALWREETFTDRKVGMIRVMTPVKADGSADLSRKPLFVGEASLMTPAGSLPLSFEIPASDLGAAVAGYGPALETAFHEAMEELKEMQRRQSSKILIPGGMPSGGLPPGGLSGKLKL